MSSLFAISRSKRFWIPIILLTAFLSSGPMASIAATTDEYYRAGLSLFQQRQFKQSTDYLKAALQMNPNHWQSYQALGHSYYQMEQTLDALNAYERALAINPNNPELQNFVNVLKSRQANGSVAASPADAAYARGEFLNALQGFEAQAGVSGSSAETQRKLGLSQFYAGQELQLKGQETLRRLGATQALGKEERYISKYGVADPSRANHKATVSFAFASPLLLGVDIGYYLKPTTNIGLGISYLPLVEDFKVSSFSPRVKFYSKPDGTSAFYGFGLSMTKIKIDENTYSPETISMTYPHFILGIGNQGKSGFTFELEWTLGLLMYKDEEISTWYYWNYSTQTYRTEKYVYIDKFTAPVLFPGLRLGYAF